MSMLQKLKESFTFNNKERSGILVLMCIIMALILANLYLPYFIKTKEFDYSKFEKEIQKFERTMDSLKCVHQDSVLKLPDEAIRVQSSSENSPAIVMDLPMGRFPAVGRFGLASRLGCNRGFSSPRIVRFGSRRRRRSFECWPQPSAGPRFRLGWDRRGDRPVWDSSRSHRGCRTSN